MNGDDTTTAKPGVRYATHNEVTYLLGDLRKEVMRAHDEVRQVAVDMRALAQRVSESASDVACRSRMERAMGAIEDDRTRISDIADALKEAEKLHSHLFGIPGSTGRIGEMKKELAAHSEQLARLKVSEGKAVVVIAVACGVMSAVAAVAVKLIGG